MAGASETLSLEQFAGWASAQAAGLTDFTVPLKRCMLLLVSETKRNFAEGHAPDGTPWLPLARPRANSKGGDLPLRNMGFLMASVTGAGNGHVESLTPTELTYGTNLEYAATHQYGATILMPEQSRPYPQTPWVFKDEGGNTVFTRRISAHTVVVPQRQFLGINEAITEGVGEIFSEWWGTKMEG